MRTPCSRTIPATHSGKTGGDNAGIYMRTDGKQMNGLVVLAFEPKELTVVNSSGSVDPAQIQALSGKLGIPTFHVGFDGKRPFLLAQGAISVLSRTPRS